MSIPVGTSVRLSTDSQLLDQAIAFVTATEGDWTDDGHRVPSDHIEVEANLVDPAIGRGIRHRTIIELDEVSDVFC